MLKRVEIGQDEHIIDQKKEGRCVCVCVCVGGGGSCVNVFLKITSDEQDEKEKSMTTFCLKTTKFGFSIE